MAPPARPSDLYRLPTDPQSAEAEPSPGPPPHGGPAWLGILALVLVGIGLFAIGTTGGGGGGGTVNPIVDVVSEDQAVAALRTHAEALQAIRDVQARSDIYADGGPANALRTAQGGQARTRQALRAARAQPGADALAAAYWHHPAHERFGQQLREVVALAGQIRLLAATHETLYSGTGEIDPQEAHRGLVSLFSGRRPATDPLAGWGEALLDEIEGRDGRATAIEGRAATQRFWAGKVAALRPPAVRELRTYVVALPAGTVEALRGHPVAGPAVEDLRG